MEEETGGIHIMKTFHYVACGMPTEDDDGKRTGQKYYTLSDYIKLLIRFDRSAHKRMLNVYGKINKMHSVIENIRKGMT